MNDTLGGNGGTRDDAPLVGVFDALTLQTINEQQLIILRQKELVSTLKARVEELESQQRRADVTPLETVHKTDKSDSTLPYASEVKLRRHLKTLEDENKKLTNLVDELRAAVSTISEKLQVQQLHTQSEKDVWKTKVSNAEVKNAATAHLLEVSDNRNQQLVHQLEKLRIEGEITAYECAQWRALATTAVSHLDEAHRRYARDQIGSIEGDVRRYAVSRLRSVRTAEADSLSLDREMPEETRKIWSRSAQLPKVHVAACVFQQQQEAARSPLYVSDQPPLLQLLPSSSHPTVSHLLPPLPVEHADAETHPLPPHCVASAET
ncbi:hypothetical protein, conserved [Leishmania tarentolae]|uniref:Uncharacterized protein n=1 Tax=Leishmania tarentolae TaxID=5689 RepID=A0A640K884_LEITA|nr:hypothetical protein, conserved [Leishmania tarentolae]